MKISRQQEQAIMRIFTARSWPKRIGAIALVLVAAFTWFEKSQIKPGQLTKGGQLQGVVVSVADGDTITLQDAEKRQYKLRLAYIDAPESAMPYGPQAKQHLARLVRDANVLAKIDDVDQYGRGIARIEKDGKDINLAQLTSGYAWHYSQYAKKNQSSGVFSEYEQAQKIAQTKHLGLWRDQNPERPWEWRKENKR